MEKEIKTTEMKETKKEEVKVQEEQKLFAIRTPFTGSSGEQYWAYKVQGQVRGRDISVDLAPKDKGGYEPLDILFDVSDKAELLIRIESTTDANGKTNKYNVFTLETTDEFGMPYQCEVKPARNSDKSLLVMLLNQIGKGGLIV